MTEMIEREAPGILKWAMEGYQRMRQAGGIRYPNETRVAIEEYRQEHFKLEAAISELFEVGQRGDSEATWESAAAVVEAINQEIEAMGHSGVRVSHQQVGTAMKNKMHFESERRYSAKEGTKVTCYLVKRKKDNAAIASL